MKQLVVENPTMFCGKKDKTRALIYGLQDGIRHNIAPIDADDHSEGSASVLIDDYDKNHNYEEDWKVLDTITKLPE